MTKYGSHFNSLIHNDIMFRSFCKSCGFTLLKYAKCFLQRTNSFRSHQMDRVKRIWYLSPMRAAKVQASLRIRAVSPEPPLLAHTSSESRGTFRQKARSLAPLNGWTCAVTICHDGMLEDTNSLDAANMTPEIMFLDDFAFIVMSRANGSDATVSSRSTRI